jgi:AhpD family alkylhydroperoxidase
MASALSIAVIGRALRAPATLAIPGRQALEAPGHDEGHPAGGRTAQAGAEEVRISLRPSCREEAIHMETRINDHKAVSGAVQAMLDLEKNVSKTGLDPVLLNLVRLRASQVNGCAYCIDMHWKDLRSDGEGEQRLYGLDAWRESPYYTDRERAALAWTEAVTRVADGHVPDEVFEEAHRHFTDAELVNLTLCVVSINGWNRFNIAFRTPAGTYQPAKRPMVQAPARARRPSAPPGASH